MGQTVKRVDLHHSGKKVIIEFDQSSVSGESKDIIETSSKITIKHAPNEELTNRFLKMVPHLMYLCELVKITKTSEDFFDNYDFIDLPEFEGINVTSVVISGKENNILKIVGTKTTTKDEVVSIVSPAIDLDDAALNAYPLRNILYANLEGLKEDALAFHNKNYIVVTQPTLF